MLVQVVALLGLGVLVLGSSAPLRAPSPASPRVGSAQDERARTLVGLIIRELLQDMKRLNFNAVPSVVTVNATLERCMHSHLKTFASTLATLNTPSRVIARKLTRVGIYKNILPKDLDEECETAQVTWDDFLNTLERFLRLLSEKIQDT
ncbi:hypothetical protein WISP_10990 [Willisornis vidua]|uniref:Interleukin-4 n=1 Tax=Willisornis vidua TaxID=1566151 RepID=A0ABQ9DRA4_9PASS|nr:hypothetical protein WISP_10990 [Willisornis vidua]